MDRGKTKEKEKKRKDERKRAKKDSARILHTSYVFCVRAKGVIATNDKTDEERKVMKKNQ